MGCSRPQSLEQILRRLPPFARDLELRQQAVETLVRRLAEMGHGPDEVTSFSLGFTADGVFHYYGASTGWVREFLDEEVGRIRLKLAGGGDAGVRVSEKDSATAVRRAKKEGVIDRTLSDPRMFGARSRGDMVRVFRTIASEAMPELANLEWRWWNYELVPNDIYDAVMRRREQFVNGLIADPDELGVEFLAWPATGSAGTVTEKEPIAKLFVEQKLGFKHVGLAQVLARWSPDNSSSG